MYMWVMMMKAGLCVHVGDDEGWSVLYMWVMMKAGLCVHVGDDEGWSVCTCG